TALRFDPENFAAHRGMGFLCLERGEYNAACWHLERAAEQRPQDATVQEALGLARERQAAAGMAPAAPAYLYASAPAAVVDPARVFEPLLAETPFLGAMVVDRQGLLLAGTFADGDHARAEALAAMLDGGVQEAERAAVYLSLGEWRGMVLETDAATLHLSRLDGGYTLVVAVTHEAPAGWLLRTAARAAALAQPLLETAA
ncbi:MAG: roadblock/LC7 domain-containing protein, partial [Gemmatimonadetes bacterium]|nr:roadblock/LC7 domain-containing protein [Gemmatimonadota bacterium]